MDKLADALGMDPVELRLQQRADAPATRSSPARSSPAPRRSPRSSAAVRRGARRRLRPTLDGRAHGAARAAPAAPPTPTTCVAASGFAVGFKNIAFSEGFDDFSTARVRLDRRRGHGDLRLRRGRPGLRHPRPAVHPRGARRRRGRARPGRHLDRLGRLHLGQPPDVDVGRRGQGRGRGRPRAHARHRRRDPRRRARHARASWATASCPTTAPSTSPSPTPSATRSSRRPSSTTTRRPSRSTSDGQGDAHLSFAFVAHRAVVDVDPELGLVPPRRPRHLPGRRQGPQPAAAARPARGRRRPGRGPGADGGDPRHRRRASGTPRSPTT